MLLSLHRLGFSSKLHNHHLRRHHCCRMSEASLASLQAFRSQVSYNLLRLSESLKVGSETFSLRWIHQCFEMLPVFNNAFAKLMAEIDYPMTKWEAECIEDYLNYTINLLQLLNSVTSSLSRLSHARVSLSHALTLTENIALERMKEIGISEDSGKVFEDKGGSHAERVCHGKDLIFHEAMLTLRSRGLWVCGVVLSGLKSDPRLLVEMSGGVFTDSSLSGLDSIIGKEITEKGGVVKEVKEVNETVGLIVCNRNGDSGVVEELRRRLEVLGSELKGLREVEEDLFAKVLAARNEVLETLRKNN